jgi:putative restriction endonuclease
MKAVFTTKAEPGYDDLPEIRYHFPAAYLNQAQAAVGDWVVYYEPRRATVELSSRGGRSAYFATARVTGVRRDPARDDHFYADIADYMEFARPVPFREGERFYESVLRRADGETSKGAFGRSVRGLPEPEYEAILAAGFAVLRPRAPGEPDGPGAAVGLRRGGARPFRTAHRRASGASSVSRRGLLPGRQGRL